MDEAPSTRVVTLDTTHDRPAFSCGEPTLDAYLRKQAGQQSRQNIAQVFVLVDAHTPERIMGYYTLSNYAIQLTELPDSITKKLPRYPLIGATLLGRLAVDDTFKGQGWGEALLFHALEKAFEASQQVASWAVVVDAKHEPAKRFYERYGFIATVTHDLKLYLPMKTIAQTLR